MVTETQLALPPANHLANPGVAIAIDLRHTKPHTVFMADFTTSSVYNEPYMVNAMRSAYRHGVDIQVIAGPVLIRDTNGDNQLQVLAKDGVINLSVRNALENWGSFTLADTLHGKKINSAPVMDGLDNGFWIRMSPEEIIESYPNWHQTFECSLEYIKRYRPDVNPLLATEEQWVKMAKEVQRRNTHFRGEGNPLNLRSFRSIAQDLDITLATV